MSRMRQAAKAVVPAAHYETARAIGYRALNIVHFGFGRFCPCCGSRLRHFHPFGEVPRPDARCPVCGSLERHRAAWLFFQRNVGLLADVGRVLHIAPEPPIVRLLRRRRDVDYLSIDLAPGNAMAVMDICDLRLPDESFDAMFCSHVLEHVADDHRAIGELYRVLRPGGWAAVQVPIGRGATLEDPSITDPGRRRLMFGQPDHVRIYGWDFEQRLARAGFSVAIDRPAQKLDGAGLRRLGLDAEEAIFFCRKPPRMGHRAEPVVLAWPGRRWPAA